MTWSMVGWAVIILAAVLLILFTFLFKKNSHYQARHQTSVDVLKSERVTAVERGERRQIILGNQLWSPAYSGLGLHALVTLPVFVNSAAIADRGQGVATSDGSLLVIARQITRGSYQDGYSELIDETIQHVTLPGVTPFSFTVGILHQLAVQKPRSLALFGVYGSESALWAASASDQGGEVFAAAGSLEAQAVLFLSVRDLLIGEEVYLMPGLVNPTPADQAAWLTEDIIRVLLIALLIAGAALKLGGVL